MKKRKWLLTAFAAASALACAVGFAACGAHTHTWADELSRDGLHHWYACTGCDEIKGEAEHDLTSGVCVCGLTPSTGLEFDLNDDENSYYVKGIGECTDTEIVIPAVYDGKPVTAIGDGAFAECTSLTSIVIPNSVTEIGMSVFVRCTSLTSIVIPNSVTKIREAAFVGCTSLTSITVDEANQNYTSLNGILYNKEKTTLVCVPNGLNGIFTIPNSVTTIEYGAFQACTSLTSIVIPNSVTTIEHEAFLACTSLTSIVIPNSVTEIGEMAFRACTSLSSITIPNSVTQIGVEALHGCTSLTSISIPNSVTQIEHGAFYGCTSLTSISIPNSVTQIEHGAFYGCTSLTSITIPKNVTEIGEMAFRACTSLTDITFEGTREQWYAAIENLGEYENITVHCSDD